MKRVVTSDLLCVSFGHITATMTGDRLNEHRYYVLQCDVSKLNQLNQVKKPKRKIYGKRLNNWSDALTSTVA